MTTPLAPVTC